MSTDVHMLSGAYALDALDPAEAEQFTQHLETCPVCAHEVQELRRAAARLGAVQAVVPPPSLRANVLAAAVRTRQAPPMVTPLPAGSWTRQWPTAWPPPAVAR